VDESITQDLPFACPTTLREVLAQVVDIMGKPSKRVIAELAAFCGDPEEQRALEHLASPEGKEQWEEQASAMRLSLLELFRRYRSLSAIPLENFLEMVPQVRLKPRYYTSSSCPLVVGRNRVSLTVKVLRDRIVSLGARRSTLGGVSSTHLAACLAGDPIRAFVQPSMFRLPPAPETPLVMVAAGTGLAPFRGFLQERRLLREGDTPLGEAILFFGCTRPDTDFICEDDLKAHLRDGELTEIVTAFSRVDPGRKVYVQHRVAERADAVHRVLVKGEGHLYICGSTAMGRAVKSAVVDALAEQMPHAGAAAYVADMEQSGRFVAELWA